MNSNTKRLLGKKRRSKIIKCQIIQGGGSNREEGRPAHTQHKHTV